MSQFSQFHLVFYQLFGLWSLLAMRFCQCLPPQCWNCLMLSAMCLLLLHNVRTFKWVWCGGSSLFKCRREALCGEKNTGARKLQHSTSSVCFLSTPSHMVWFPKPCRKIPPSQEMLIQALQAQLPLPWPSHIRKETPLLRSGPGQDSGHISTDI